VNFDFSLFKDFPITEQVKVQFRTEFFNVFNTPQFDLLAATIGAGNVGTTTSIAGIPRQIQFGLRLRSTKGQDVHQMHPALLRKVHTASPPAQISSKVRGLKEIPSASYSE
jgi:hypothetical protein